MLPWIGAGDPRSARPARMDKPLRCRPLEGRRDQKSPLRRCFKPRPPLSAGCAGFASGCRSRVLRKQLASSGGCPASCPDAHRPTHGHRHVRNWAIRHISDLTRCQEKIRTREKNLGASERAAMRSRGARRAASLSPRGERLDALRGADEGDHDGDAAGEEQALQDVLAVGRRVRAASATAQPPAKAAPNTSAPIRIAALTTVSTFCHAIRRSPVRIRRLVIHCIGPVAGAISPKVRPGSSSPTVARMKRR